MKIQFKILLIMIFTIPIFPVLVNSSGESVNVLDNRMIGYEFLNSTFNIVDVSNATIIHIWNTEDDYYFNKSSGIQFSNYFNEYWTKNIFCAGYKDQSENWIYDCNDELPFNWNIKTDNLTYVNITGWRDKSIGIKTVRLGLRYHLKINDKNLSVQPSIKNIGSTNITQDLGFAWVTKDIKIRNDYAHDIIMINGSSYDLHDNNLNINFTNMEDATYMLYDRGYIRLNWDNNLNYKVEVKNTSDYNARVTLGINAGPLYVGQTKTTTIFWKDPISYVSVATGSTAALTSGMTWNHDIVCGDDMVLIVGISVDSEPTATVSSITYNNTDLSKIASVTSPGTKYEEQVEMWNLSNPHCGEALPIVVGYNNPTAEESAGISAVYYHVDYINASSVSTNNSEDSTSSSVSVNTSSVNNWVVNVFALDNDAGSAISVSGDSVTQRGYSDQDVTVVALADGYDNDGSVTIGWSGFNDEWAQIGVELIPAPEISSFSNPTINDTLIFTGENINHSITIYGIPSNYLFSWNASGANCDTWVNSSWISVDGEIITASNVSEIPSACSDKEIGWMFCGNNSKGQNCSDIQLYNVSSYGWLNVSLTYPSSTLDVSENNTFDINGTISCEGLSQALCGEILAYAQYNYSDINPDTSINITDGADPFYIFGGDSNWIETNVSGNTYEFNSLAIGDADNDGLNEIVAGYSGSGINELRIYNWINDKWSETNITDGLSLYKVIIGDVDNDGLNEIVVGLNGIHDYELKIYNWSESSWSQRDVEPAAYTGNIGTLAIGDADNDGLNEIVVGYSGPVDKELKIYNWSSKSWSETDVNTNIDLIKSLTIGDADNDGLNEIVVGYIGTVDKELRLYNWSSKRWSETNISNNLNTIYSIAIGDADNDGLNEIVAGYYSTVVNELKKYNYIDKTWSEIDINDDVDGNIKTLAIGDTNNDDLNEIAAGYSSVVINELRIYNFTSDSAENPVSYANLNSGEEWNVSWTINISSSTTESYLIDVLFNSSYGPTNIIKNDTNNILINLNPSGVDSINPTYSDNAHNTTLNGTTVLFSILYDDNIALHPDGQYIFSTNNTGIWVNESAVNFISTPSSANKSMTLNTTVGLSIGYRWYANDTASNINNTDIFTLTITEPAVDTCTCPGLNNDWEIDMEDYCIISEHCGIGTGILNFTNAGNVTFDAIINASEFGYIYPSQSIYITANNGINIG